ncbi:hypothetical protein C8T65DRAFT_736344 [Cerioporus squamosus]|nr:hypothetical protein C8T65DRAFT_736344 [Cerioporus squamosus]
MSSEADADDAATVELFSKIYTEQCCVLAASVLFIYESVSTFDREAACFWTAKWAAAPLLFFTNKWISMAINVMALFQFASFPSDEVGVGFAGCIALRSNSLDVRSCSMFQIAVIAMVILQFVLWAVFSAQRAYVLSKSKLLGLLVLALSLSPVDEERELISMQVQYGYHVSGENLPPLAKCFEIDDTTDANWPACNGVTLIRGTRTVVIVSRVPLIVADMLLIGITWTKISSRNALRDICQSKRLSLSDILFRDGTIYFIILFILNTLHLAFSATAVAGNGAESYVTLFTTTLTAILVSRFLLDLQEANQAVIRVDPDDPLHFSGNPYDDAPSFVSPGACINPDLPTPRDHHSESNEVASHPDEEGQGVVSSSSM